jgi:glycosyltransferase involved in cell wall biosynthesis
VGRYARELSRALAKRAVFDYVLFVADRVPRETAARAVGDHALPTRCSALPARLHTLLWHRLGVPLAADRWTGPVDVFHATDFLVPPLGRARAVVTVHDLSFLRVPDRAAPGLARFLARAVPLAAQRAAHVLADSQNTRRDVIELLGVDPDHVTVAYPGTSSTFRRVTDPAELWRVTEQYRLDRPYVLGVGTIEPRKDWPTLIAAFEATKLAATHTLAIAGGRGWLTEEVDRAVAASASDVRLLGLVPDRDLAALYSQAAAFAYPSVYEGFGLPPLEALSCGTPTVVSSAACLPEVVSDAALVVPPGEPASLAAALHRLVEDRALRLRLSQAGPERAAQFTWDECARAAERAYEAAALSRAGA